MSEEIQRLQRMAHALQGEVRGQAASRVGATLIAPNAQREIKNKHRPTHWINVSRLADGTQLGGGTVATSYELTFELPIGFEFHYATFDEADALYWGIINFEIDKYSANAGRGQDKNTPGPLSGLGAIVEHAFKWAPSGMPDKAVSGNDLKGTVTVWCWKTTTDPFHGITIHGVDHSNYCPIQDRIAPPKRGVRVLQQLGPSARGIVQRMVGGLGGRAEAISRMLGDGSDPPRGVAR